MQPNSNLPSDRRTLLREMWRATVWISVLAVALCPIVQAQPLIVIGFMGGNVKAGNLVHKEAVMAKALQERYPVAVHATMFANHDGKVALKTILADLDENQDGRLSASEKNAARIVIFGHSWGGSETITLAKQLNTLGIPVLLTIQVDSVEKSGESDGRIPPNVREAINFYQTEGLLHGRSLIEAMDPKQTTILGNYESTYKDSPVSLAGYPWFARTFMKSHIEIENDPRVWDKIEALIQTRVLGDESVKSLQRANGTTESRGTGADRP